MKDQIDLQKYRLATCIAAGTKEKLAMNKKNVKAQVYYAAFTAGTVAATIFAMGAPFKWMRF